MATIKKRATEKVAGSAEKAYAELRQLAVNYGLRPGERINEVSIAERIGVSRTPVREALNRLVAENLIHFEPQRGFVARKLDLDEILHLYEVRIAVETAAFRLSCARATDQNIAQQERDWIESTGEKYADMTVGQIISADEKFHHDLAALSGNVEMVSILDRVMDQIRYCRMIDLEFNWRLEVLYDEHLKIMRHLAMREEKEGVEALTNHIMVSRETGLNVMKEALARIYMS